MMLSKVPGANWSPGLPCDRHEACFRGVFESPVRAPLSSNRPAVGFEHPENVTNLHRTILFHDHAARPRSPSAVYDETVGYLTDVRAPKLDGK